MDVFLAELSSLIVFCIKIFQFVMYFFILYWIYKSYCYLKQMSKMLEDNQNRNEKIAKLLVEELKTSLSHAKDSTIE